MNFSRSALFHTKTRVCPKYLVHGFRLNWSSYGGIAKTTSIGALTRSVKFLSSEVTLYSYKSIIRPCIDYSRHAWAGA